MRLGLVSRLSSLALVAAAMALVPGLGSPAAAGTTVFPVPTSSAGLGRIVTAPDGNMWFVEADANKVGRITPSGQITEYPFPAEFPGTTTLKDLDVAPDGTIWVVYESGERARHMNPDGSTITDGVIGSYPYGEQVRVGPDGTAWITMSFDEDYVIRIVGSTIYEHPNAPECEDSLGEAADGSMWCRQGAGLIHLNADASGGVTYPAGRFAAYPYAIAAGPVGSIWFGRYSSGTMFTSPSDGEVGYLDAGTAQITAFDTGSRTAPADLVQGPDGSMWFTSIGAAAGIGHVSPQGTGALTAIGGYEPESLTFAHDGSIFATDPTNNVIIRVTTDGLQQTNVDPGDGSVFTQGPTTPTQPGTPGATVAGTVKAPKKPVRIKRNRVPVTIACPADAAGCRGKATLRSAKKPHKILARAATYQVKPGKKKTVRLKLTKAGRKAVRTKKVTRLRVELSAKGAQPVRKIVRVRR